MTEFNPERCMGACCSNVRLALYADEAIRLREAGAELLRILPPMQTLVLEPTIEPDEEELFCWSKNTDGIKQLSVDAENDLEKAFWLGVAESALTMRPGQGLYKMNGDCAFLTTDGFCDEYEDRPYICRNFTVGSAACLSIRRNVVEPVPVTLTQKLVS